MDLGGYTAQFGAPGRINTNEDEIGRWTAGDLQRLAREYWTPANRTVVTLLPAPKPATPAAAPSAAGGAAEVRTERKQRAPVSEGAARVRMPAAREAVLANGLTVLAIEDHRSPLVRMQLKLRGAGALHDPPELRGLALITARMLSEGTRSRTSAQIAEESTRTGAQIAASIGPGTEEAIITASGLKSNLAEWLPLVADVSWSTPRSRPTS
jgi:zinc protease